MASINAGKVVAAPTTPSQNDSGKNPVDASGSGLRPTIATYEHPVSDQAIIYDDVVHLPFNTFTDGLSLNRWRGLRDKAAAEKLASRESCNGAASFKSTIKKDAFAGAYKLRQALSPATAIWDTITYGTLVATSSGVENGFSYAGFSAGQYLGNATKGKTAQSLHYPYGSPATGDNLAYHTGELGSIMLGGVGLGATTAVAGLGAIASAAPKVVIYGLGGLFGGAYGVLRGAAQCCKKSPPAVGDKACSGDKAAPNKQASEPKQDGVPEGTGAPSGDGANNAADSAAADAGAAAVGETPTADVDAHGQATAEATPNESAAVPDVAAAAGETATAEAPAPDVTAPAEEAAVPEVEAAAEPEASAPIDDQAAAVEEPIVLPPTPALSEILGPSARSVSPVADW